MAENWDDDAPVETAPAQIAEIPEIKLFGRWSTEEIQVNDISLTVSNL